MQIDAFLAQALNTGSSIWPQRWHDPYTCSRLVERVRFHGITGLLFARCGELENWPNYARDQLRASAVAQAMWEMRHKVVISDMLSELAGEGILAVVLKGTALAYDLYPVPAARTRGDTDVLVRRQDLAHTRAVLKRLGFSPFAEPSSDRWKLQEVWQSETGDGALHEIDLHWELVNSHALSKVLTFDDCTAKLHNLRELCDHAIAMNREMMLMHACIHRAQQQVSPYFVDGAAYYNGNRLIWLYDIHLLSQVLSPEGWGWLCDVSLKNGMAPVCLAGLEQAIDQLDTPVPEFVVAALGSASARSYPARYLLHSGQARRAWIDLAAIKGIPAKLAYILHRLLPSASFMRAKYSQMENRPVVMLYLRRFAELWRRRVRRGQD